MKYNFLKHNPHDEIFTYDAINELDKRYSLPLYIYDGGAAADNAMEIKEILGNKVRLCYSVKANYFIAEALDNTVDMFEVCTGGELEYCLRNNISGDKLVYNGVWKSEQDLQCALEAGVNKLVLDSVEQAQQLQDVAKEPVKVFLRLSSGNQFGMSLEEIVKIEEDRSRYSRLDIQGIHYYAGTQRRCVRQVKEDIQILTEALEYLQSRGIRIEEIQMGGGLGVPLYVCDNVREYEETADYLFTFIQTLSRRYNVTYECGRVIVANAGKYITQIFEKKRRKNREILLVKGGSHHLRYYGNVVGQRQPFIDSVRRNISTEECRYMICGSLCSAGDILSMTYTQKRIEKGDYMIFYNAGAYSLQEASSLFLTMEMPCVLVYNKNINNQKLVEIGWTYSDRRIV